MLKSNHPVRISRRTDEERRQENAESIVREVLDHLRQQQHNSHSKLRLFQGRSKEETRMPTRFCCGDNCVKHVKQRTAHRRNRSILSLSNITTLISFLIHRVPRLFRYAYKSTISASVQLSSNPDGMSDCRLRICKSIWSPAIRNAFPLLS